MVKTNLVCLLLGSAILLSGCSGNKIMKKQDNVGRQSEQHMERRISLSLEYLLYLPPDYDKQESWPLMVFLHGAGERGNDLNKLKVHGPPKLVETGKDLPFVIVSPQCPADQWWPGLEREVIALVDEMIDKYKIDTSRVYLTGLSMGGFGTWSIGCSYPQRFAAMVPICGGGRPFRAGLTEGCAGLGVSWGQRPGRTAKGVAADGRRGQPGRRQREADGLSECRTRFVDRNV